LASKSFLTFPLGSLVSGGSQGRHVKFFYTMPDRCPFRIVSDISPAKFSQNDGVEAIMSH
jgi:hypothetical protein